MMLVVVSNSSFNCWLSQRDLKVGEYTTGLGSDINKNCLGNKRRKLDDTLFKSLFYSSLILLILE